MISGHPFTLDLCQFTPLLLPLLSCFASPSVADLGRFIIHPWCAAAIVGAQCEAAQGVLKTLSFHAAQDGLPADAG